MKRRQKTRIIVHMSTLIYFMACLVTGWFKESLIAFFIVLCHEYAHTWTAKMLHYEVLDIHLYPFGAFVEIEDYGLHQNWQDFLVAVSGPLSYFLLYWCGDLMRTLLGEHGYLYYTQVNMAVCLFNLLPIWPLDGAKILLTGLSYRFDYLLVLKLLLPISFMSLSALIFFIHEPSYFLAYSYLFTQIVIYGRDFYYLYLRLLFSRESSDVKRKMKLHCDRTFLKPYQNFYFLKGRIIDEKEFINTKIFIDND